MTAIAGVVGVAGHQLLPTCEAMLHELKPYGGRTATAACDVAIFGTTVHSGAAGRAPVYSPSGQYFCIADIRLDNRDEIRRSLGIAEMTDLQLLAAAWERWGKDCLNHIAGDFAAAVFNRQDGELTLARDHSGQRPLFYSRRNEHLAFASMPSALLAGSQTPVQFNMDRLAAIQIGAPANSEDSYFIGIIKVRPGEWVTLVRTGERRETYWNPRRELPAAKRADLLEAYHAQLEQAVRSRLDHSCEEAGIQLSSGFDSNSIAATAARICNARKPVAFTAAPGASFNGPVPRGRIGDESSLASLTAKRLGMRHVVVRPVGTMLSNLSRHTTLYQDPDRNVANMQWWSALLGQANELGIRTMLTGQMGNLSIHAGGLPVLSEWVRRLQLGTWWHEARLAAKAGAFRWRGIAYNSFNPWISQPVQRLLWRQFQGEPADRENYLRREWSVRVQSRSAGEAGPPRTGNLFDDRLAIIRTQDTGVFRLGALAEAGIEELDPTADRRLIEWSLNLPPEALFHDGVSRPLARQALEGRLPTEVLDNRLRGYQAADWFERIDRNEAHDLIDEIAGSHAVNELLDLERMRWAIEHWPKSDQASAAARMMFRRRWTLALSTGLFLKRFETSA